MTESRRSNITGGSLKAIDYKMPVASAQVKSCVLLAGLFAKGETRVEEPLRTRDHTEVALRAFGVELNRKAAGAGSEVRIRGGQRLRGLDARIPGDLSSAAFFLCAAALFPGSQLTIPHLLMNPTRARLLDILMQMGLHISVTQMEEVHGELVGSLQVEGAALHGTTIAGADAAALIDEIPVLAAIAPFTEQGMEIRDAKELRVKESDRIAALAANLRQMGARSRRARRRPENPRRTIPPRRRNRFPRRPSHRHGIRRRGPPRPRRHPNSRRRIRRHLLPRLLPHLEELTER